MTTQQVLDFSNFSGIPTPAQFDALKADGWDGVILGTQFPNITHQQYHACQLNQFPVVGLYVFVYWDSEDSRRIAEANQLAAEFGLPVWIDCEWDKVGFPGSGPAPNPATILTLIQHYKDELGSAYAGIYTGRWWWVPYTGDSQQFSGDKLWYAAYSTPSFDDFHPFGGWVRPVIWQYSSDGTQGVNADLNLMEVVTVADPSVEECVQALVALAHFIRNGWNLADLSDGDKAAIKFAAGKVPS